MKTLLHFPRVILTAMAAMVGLSQAGILFQDGFNYQTGALNGTQNGGTGFASGSSWGNSDGADVISTGLKRLGFLSAGTGALKSKTKWTRPSNTSMTLCLARHAPCAGGCEAITMTVSTNIWHSTPQCLKALKGLILQTNFPIGRCATVSI